MGNNGTLNGAGSLTNPTIAVVNNNTTTSAVTINNGELGTVRNSAGAGGANSVNGWAVVTSTNGGANFSTNLEPVNVNNLNYFTGRVWLGAGADSFTNGDAAKAGEWSVSGGATATTSGAANQLGNGSTITNNIGSTIFINSSPTVNLPGNFAGFLFSNTGAQTGTNSFLNNGIVQSSGSVNFQFTGANSATVITNNGLTGNGIFNVGSVPNSATESTSFTSAGVQSVTNTGTFNIIGHGTGTASIGNAAAAATGPSDVGALNFQGASVSSFNNTGGLINMSADASSTTNAVTFNTTALGGTNDSNYTYAFTGNTYNFVGGANSRVMIDTFLGAPVVSTSDRIVVGGNVNVAAPGAPINPVTGLPNNPVTQLIVNDTNQGAGAFNALGITVAAVQGAGNNNFVVSPQSVGYVPFGPLGAINKGFFIDPLIYVPTGAGPVANPNANLYKFFGIPGPFAFNLPVAHTATQNIWSETALSWEDRQDELRTYFRCGMIASHQSTGSGADLAVKAPPAPPPCTTTNNVWVKAIASGTDRKATDNFATAFGIPALGVLGTWDNSYRQTIYGVQGGIDFGKMELTSPTDSLVFGIMGGYINSPLQFASPNVFFGPTSFTRFNYSGGTIGGSATYMNGGFFADALVKADFLRLDIGGIPAGFLGGVRCLRRLHRQCDDGRLPRQHGLPLRLRPVLLRAVGDSVLCPRSAWHAQPAGCARGCQSRHRQPVQHRRWRTGGRHPDGRPRALPRGVVDGPRVGSRQSQQHGELLLDHACRRADRRNRVRAQRRLQGRLRRSRAAARLAQPRHRLDRLRQGRCQVQRQVHHPHRQGRRQLRLLT